ncbi:ProQ/FinO family protein [Cupriavidus basilensis]|uniref:ProQ/FinO family protein n=1 Tax=Cupriavidus basilensis TaxID=68895 RepID=A0ABT6APU2_9BURK|nr:ProQ/FinO family protein [Cupriavidus basilensis]MDF3834649.1 ProQ/FinO family protein [Cupriavidus basilensis]
MGFEQLAALKEQLAKQAKAAPRQAKAEPRVKTRRAPPAASVKQAKPVSPASPAKPVDPVVQAIGKLQKRFPQTFPKNPAPKVPLKIGIFEDLVPHAQELGLTESILRDAIRTWCRGTRYWTCMVEGAPRVDLANQEAGQVSQADAKRAQQLQAHRTARTVAKPAAEPKPN